MTTSEIKLVPEAIGTSNEIKMVIVPNLAYPKSNKEGRGILEVTSVKGSKWHTVVFESPHDRTYYALVDGKWAPRAKVKIDKDGIPNQDMFPNMWAAISYLEEYLHVRKKNVG